MRLREKLEERYLKYETRRQRKVVRSEKMVKIDNNSEEDKGKAKWVQGKDGGLKRGVESRERKKQE